MGAGGRRPRTVAVLLAAVLAAAVATVSWAWFAWYPHHRPALRTAESLGIDVRHHQGRIDWARVAADGVAFAYVKASEGGTVVDDRFRENWAGSRAAGVRRGAYHFFTLCRSGTEQARLFLRTVPRDPAALPPAVDLELAGNCASRPSRASVRRELDDFLTAVERSSGRDTVLYVGEDWQDRYPVLGRSARPAWLVSFLGRPDTSWSVWQVSWRARVDGVPGPVDLDVGRLGDLASREAVLGEAASVAGVASAPGPARPSRESAACCAER